MQPRKKKRKKADLTPFYAILILFAVVLALLVGLLWGKLNAFVPPSDNGRGNPSSLEKTAGEKGRAKKPVLCFVIDDVGQNMEQLRPFLAFPGSLTLAVIPFLPHSREAMEACEKAGKLVILHEPMQALGKQDPGVGALLLTDSETQIRAKLSLALEGLPMVKGMNNHMGSAFTEDEEHVRVVLDFAQKRGLFFLDSKTTPRSVVKKVGTMLGMRIQERDVFLDNEKSREYMLQAIEDGKKTAREKGRAVMIGHVWSSDLAQIMMEIYPTLLEEGYTLEDLSRFMQGDFTDENPGD